MAKRAETVALNSEIVSETQTGGKESVIENAEMRNGLEDVFTLEKELIEIGLKNADTLKKHGVPMNSQQIATLETLLNLYESLKN